MAITTLQTLETLELLTTEYNWTLGTGETLRNIYVYV